MHARTHNHIFFFSQDRSVETTNLELDGSDSVGVTSDGAHTATGLHVPHLDLLILAATHDSIVCIVTVIAIIGIIIIVRVNYICKRDRAAWRLCIYACIQLGKFVINKVRKLCFICSV